MSRDTPGRIHHGTAPPAPSLGSGIIHAVMSLFPSDRAQCWLRGGAWSKASSSQDSKAPPFAVIAGELYRLAGLGLDVRWEAKG